MNQEQVKELLESLHLINKLLIEILKTMQRETEVGASPVALATWPGEYPIG